MRSITLNIGRALGPASQFREALKGRAYLDEHEVLGWVAMRLGNVVRWSSWNTPGEEPTMVVQVDIGGLAQRSMFPDPATDDIEGAAWYIGGHPENERVEDGLIQPCAQLCWLLGQEAIAWHDGLNGHMSGPMADKWGPFNGQYFICMDGERLVDADGKERVDQWFAN